MIDSHPHTAQPRLLIVDDDSRIRELAEFAARTSGEFGPVSLAGDGEEALEMLRFEQGTHPETLPDLILTDLSMPRVNGFDLVARLQEDPSTRDIPIVMFSSSGLPYDRERALAAGCRAFFEKPATLTGLVSLLRTIADLWRHQGASVRPGPP